MDVKQSAVEWLVEQLVNDGKLIYDDYKEIEQAKEMEKEQHKNTFKQSRLSYIFDKEMPPVWKTFEQYYNETFKSE